jgi:flagellar motor switch protein FliG
MKANTPLERISMFLMILESEKPGVTKDILSGLNDTYVQKINSIIEATTKIDPKFASHVVDDFYSLTFEEDSPNTPEIEADPEVFSQESKDKSIEDVLSELESYSLMDVYTVLSKQEKDIQALFFRYFPSEYSSRLILKFDKKHQYQLSKDILNCSPVNSAWVKDLFISFVQELQVKESTASHDDALLRLSQILEKGELELQQDILGHFEDKKDPNFDQLNKMVIKFSDLSNLPDDQIQLIIEEVMDLTQICIAISDVPEKEKERFIFNLTDRQKIICKQLRKDIKDVSKEEIDNSKREMVKIARKLGLNSQINKIKGAL